MGRWRADQDGQAGGRAGGRPSGSRKKHLLDQANAVSYVLAPKKIQFAPHGHQAVRRAGFWGLPLLLQLNPLHLSIRSGWECNRN